MPDKFVTNVPKEEALAAADAAYMPKGMVTVPFNPQLINTGSKLILIDTGNGVANLEPTKGAVGRTLQNLAAAGVDPKRSTSSCCRICIPTTPTASAPPMARWRSRTPRSWCRRSTGRSGPVTKTPPRRNPTR